ncbi:MAG: hypothetical protein EOP88_27985 [Verrucomicrobiaceae bacterium]|nr:MAG: hypothetical protein EOP88_27985 [Verrucomicrobiaceae bacterium]
MAPASTKMELGTPTTQKVADIVAEAIVLNRPYSGMGELSAAKTANKDSLFGNRDLYSLGTNINWSDSAAEELFARIHDASTFRSRNFRVWVIGQSLTGSESNPEIIAEARKVYTVFADPGERDGQGQINIQNNKSRVTYENGF